MNRWLRVLVPIVVLLLGFSGVTYLFVNAQQTNTVHETPVWTPGQTPPATTPAPSGTPSPTPTGCQPHKPIVPVKFTVERMQVNSPVLSLGWDPNTGAAAAPPDKDAYTVGWLNEGPKPGSDKGNVVLTSHTYHVGRALGNDLYDAANGLRAGDLITMSDASGYTVCYHFREALKVWLADYAKAPSNVLYDNDGRSQLALIVCWDWDWKARMSQSRIIFYADPVAA